MITEVETVVKINPGIENIVQRRISDILYSIARQCLDVSYAITPRQTGKMANSSMAQGVSDLFYNHKQIGNYTDYAYSVWTKDAQKTQWTTPGTTSRWFEETLKTKKESFMANALKQHRL